MLCVSCAIEEPAVEIKSEDVVEMLVAQTLEAYRAQPELTTTNQSEEQDAEEGTSVEVTQQVRMPADDGDELQPNAHPKTPPTTINIRKTISSLSFFLFILPSVLNIE